MTDKTFRFATTFQNAIKNASYDDGSPIQYGGDVFVQIAISEWERIGTADKANITAKAAQDNFLPID